jgi:cysteine-rich repeat protein
VTRPPPLLRPRTLTLASAFALLFGCWNGADSTGLPCENNSHCGRGVDCIAGFCGGQASEALCGNGWLDPGEACDDAEQNAVDGACRPDCTAELCGDGVQGPSEACDLGPDNDDQGACKTDCTLAVCGDGFVGPGEACDDGNTAADDGCSPTCMLESCGNGIVDPGEDCDDGEQTATCDDDCTEVVCGDLNVNEAAGEDCDNDAPAVDDRLCLANCTIPLLWDDMEPDTPPVAWTHAKVSGGPSVTDTWLVTPRNPADGMRSWDSGLPAAAPGDIRLTTPTLDLSGLDGQAIELRFDHARRFRDCGNPTSAYEGAVVEIAVDGGPYVIIAPDDGYPGTVGDGLCTENPLVGEQAFTLDEFYTTETFDLSAYAGSSVELGFRAGWDCGNCPDDQTGRGWFIDNVVVWRK